MVKNPILSPKHQTLLPVWGGLDFRLQHHNLPLPIGLEHLMENLEIFLDFRVDYSKSPLMP